MPNHHSKLLKCITHFLQRNDLPLQVAATVTSCQWKLLMPILQDLNTNEVTYRKSFIIYIDLLGLDYTGKPPWQQKIK